MHKRKPIQSTTERSRYRAERSGLLIVALLAFCALTQPKVALAQTSIGVEIAGGATVPVGAFDRYVARLDPELAVDGEGPSQLIRLRPGPGFQLALAAHVGALSFRYRFTRTTWRDDQLQCAVPEERIGTPAGTAYLQGNGEIDDSAVDYRCSRDLSALPAQAGRSALVLHDVHVRYRLEPRRALPVIPSLLLGGGLSLTTFDANSSLRPLRPGLLLSVGAGFRVPIDSQISIVLDSGYDLRLLARAGNYALRASRIVEAERSVAAAIFSPLHAFSFNLGIILTIR